MRVTPSLDTLYSVVIHEGPYVQTDPAIVFTGADHIAVWSDMRFTGGYYWIVASRIDTSGAVLDTGFCIGAQILASECLPDIAYDGTRCFAVWYNYDEPLGVHGRFVNHNGQPEGEVIKVASTLASFSVDARVTFCGENYLVVWADQRPGFSDLDINGQFVSTQGELVGEPFVIATGEPNQMYPKVAFDGNVSLAIWREGPAAIYGQRIYPNGGLCGGNFPVSDTGLYYRYDSGIDMSSSNYLVVWTESRVGATDIYGNVDVATPVEEPFKLPMPGLETTFFSGSLAPLHGAHRVYDVCGREVSGQAVSTGIYFVETTDRRVRKVVILK